MKPIKGNAWVYGDNIDTDLLAPGSYMREPMDVIASHCLEAIDPEFASQVKPGDILVAGEAFGMGSSREQAVQALLELGVGAVVANSFARIFYRNALNLGLPVLNSDELNGITKADQLELDISTGELINHSRNQTLTCEPIPDFLVELIAAGGLLAQLKNNAGRA